MLVVLEKFLTICNVERGLSNNTIQSYRRDLKEFIEFIKIDLKKVDKKIIRQFLETLHLKQLKRSSYLRKLSSVSQFMQFLIEENYIQDNPMIDIKRPKKEKKLPKFLIEKDVQYLIETAQSDNKFGIRMACIIEFLYASGMRISELLSLKVTDIIPIQKNHEKLIMIKGKGAKERLVPVRNQTIDLLEKYLAVRNDFVKSQDGSKYLFCSRGGKGHLTREQVGMTLKKIALLANIDPNKVSPHVFRHSFATKLCHKKVNLRVLQELLGHSDISTTEIYIETADSEIIDFVKNNHPMGDNKN